jgi:SPP1 gp7 family putative phage head morphogenesis protein
LKAFNAYKKWVDERDRALETIYANTMIKITDETRLAFAFIVERLLFGQPITGHDLMPFATNIMARTHEMKVAVYQLAGASELEILGRLYNKNTTWKPDLTKVPINFYDDRDPIPEILKSFKKVIQRLEMVLFQAQAEGRMVEPSELMAVLPKLEPMPSRIVLKKVKEAKKELVPDFTTSEITDDEWDDVLYDYKNTYRIQNRGPEDVVGSRKTATGKRVVYRWELEKEVTQDFVSATRKGQTDAAKKSGIKDFVWIAILDNRTDECCEKRDGLTTSEIEVLLKTKWRGDKLRGKTPPLHFNCRCTLAPVTKDLPDIPSSKVGEFNDWLDS